MVAVNRAGASGITENDKYDNKTRQLPGEQAI